MLLTSSGFIVIRLPLKPVVGNLEVVKRLLNLFVLVLHKLGLCVHVLHLILDDFDVVLSGSQIVLQLGLLRLLSRLGQLQIADLLLQISDVLSLCIVLVLEHLLSLRWFNYTNVLGVEKATGFEVIKSSDQFIVLLFVEVQLLSDVFITFLVACEQLISDHVLLSQHLVLLLHFEI